jgi:hypothetical protein
VEKLDSIVGEEKQTEKGKHEHAKVQFADGKIKNFIFMLFYFGYVIYFILLPCFKIDEPAATRPKSKVGTLRKKLNTLRKSLRLESNGKFIYLFYFVLFVLFLFVFYFSLFYFICFTLFCSFCFVCVILFILFCLCYFFVVFYLSILFHLFYFIHFVYLFFVALTKQRIWNANSQDSNLR